MRNMEDDVNPTSHGQLLNFSFTGSGSEYFRIWVLNILRTIKTFGSYSTEARARSNQYFNDNTFLGKEKFSYLGEGKQKIGRMWMVLALFYYIVTYSALPSQVQIGLYIVFYFAIPILISIGMEGKCRSFMYRNIRFKFDTDFKQAIGVFLLPFLVIFLVIFAFKHNQLFPDQISEFIIGFLIMFFGFLFFLLPWIEYRCLRFIIQHTYYGKTPMFFKVHYSSFFLYLIIHVISLLIIIMIFNLSLHIPTIPVLVFNFLIVTFMAGVYRASRYNYIYNSISVGSNRVRCRLNPLVCGWIYVISCIGLILSLGLFLPWVRVRSAQHLASKTQIYLVNSEV